jgi:DNA-binding NtrC family response regulator
MDTNIRNSNDSTATVLMPEPISLDGRLRELEARLITWALTASRGNKSRAAALLQIKRSTLGDRIRRCGLDHAPEPPVLHRVRDSGASL